MQSRAEGESGDHETENFLLIDSWDLLLRYENFECEKMKIFACEFLES